MFLNGKTQQFDRTLAIPEQTVAANLFSEAGLGSIAGLRSAPSNWPRNTLSSCSQSLSFISVDSFSAVSSALVSLSGMGPILLRHPAAISVATSPKKNRDATHPKALIALTLSRIETRLRNDSQVGHLTSGTFSNRMKNGARDRNVAPGSPEGLPSTGQNGQRYNTFGSAS